MYRDFLTSANTVVVARIETRHSNIVLTFFIISFSPLFPRIYFLNIIYLKPSKTMMLLFLRQKSPPWYSQWQTFRSRSRNKLFIKTVLCQVLSLRGSWILRGKGFSDRDGCCEVRILPLNAINIFHTKEPFTNIGDRVTQIDRIWHRTSFSPII